MKYHKIVWQIIVKNIKLIYRARVSSLIILLGPLIIVGIIGAAFNTQGLHSITVAYYQKENSTVINDILGNLKSRDYNVESYDTLEGCIDSVKTSNSHICIQFPDKIDPSVTTKGNEITFYIDYSRINLAMVIWESMSHKVSKKGEELSIGFVQSLLDMLSTTSDQLSVSKQSLEEMAAGATNLSAMLSSYAARTQNASFDISGFDFEQVDDSLNQTESLIKQFKKELNDSQAMVDNTSALVEIRKKESLGLIGNLSVSVNSTEAFIDEAIADLEFLYNNTCNNGSTLPFDGCNNLESTLNDIYTQKANLLMYKGLIENAETEINSLGIAELAMISDRINSSQSLIGDAEKNIGEFKSGIASANASYASAQEQLDQFEADKALAVLELVSAQMLLEENVGKIQNMSTAIDELNVRLQNVTSIRTETLLKPIKTILKPVTAQKSAFDFLFPSLLTLVVMFVAILLSSTTILNERASRAHFRNYLTPVLDPIFVIGAVLSNLFIVLLQSGILSIIAYIFFKISITSDLLGLIMSLSLVSSVFILLGVIIGFLFNSEETATIASITISIILFFFSSLVVPIEQMVPSLAFFASKSPFVLGEAIFRKILIFNAGIMSAGYEIMMMSIYFVVLFVAAVFAQKLTKNKL
ncbi:ABC transporter permease [Nanoarchaeota archaeon]